MSCIAVDLMQCVCIFLGDVCCLVCTKNPLSSFYYIIFTLLFLVVQILIYCFIGGVELGVGFVFCVLSFTLFILGV